MKKILFIAILVGSLFFVKDVNAQVGCCTGNVNTGTAYCPGGNQAGWYCTNTTTAYSCSGLDYGTCIATRPSSFPGCDQTVDKCTGCGWSTSCTSGGGGGGGGTCDWSQVNCPAGTVVVPTSYYDYCGAVTYCPGPGTAQAVIGCCGGQWIPGECVDVWKPAYNEWVTECEPDEYICRRQTIRTYGCAPTTPTCSSAGPTGNPTINPSLTTYDVFAYGTSANTTSVSFAVWSETNGQDDIRWYTGTNLGGGTWRGTVILANHTSSGQYRVHAYLNGTTFCSSADFIRNPTCIVDLLPPVSSITPSATTPLTASITSSFGVITQVNFASSNSSLVSVSTPGYDTTSAYSTTASGNSVGTATITASVIMSGSTICSDTASVTVTNPGPWWQVKDGDITAENGGILSTVPAATYFDTDGTGGFPGVPTYYNGSLNYGSGLLSTKQWSANTTTTQSRTFNYSYFNNLIPSDFVSPTTYDGYVWTKISGAHTLSATDFTTNKNVLFVNGDLNITGNIALTDGTGFFLAIVSGNINISPTVTNLEGIYLSDGTFSSGAGTVQLQTRGSVASYGGISLQRDLTNNTQPAELFTFAPDQIALFPEKLGFRRTRWTEVAP